jgi:hypothetical protein
VGRAGRKTGLPVWGEGLTRVLAALGVVVAAVVLSGVAVQAVGDRRTLVPPPDAVVEDFLRQVTTRRCPQALPLLSEELRSAVGPKLLEDYRRRLEGELGRVGTVTGELVEICGDRAKAFAILAGARGAKRVRFNLVWENGKWMIEQVGELQRTPTLRSESDGAPG